MSITPKPLRIDPHVDITLQSGLPQESLPAIITKVTEHFAT
jgi:hypothetical protein